MDIETGVYRIRATGKGLRSPSCPFHCYKKTHLTGNLNVLGRTMASVKGIPRHIVCDQGTQLACDGFRLWCKRNIGKKTTLQGRRQLGSFTVIERFIRTVKYSYLKKTLTPLRMDQMQERVTVVCNWYNEHRPHDTLNGATPFKICESQTPANLKPQYEPQKIWPKTSGYAASVVPIKGKRGVQLELQDAFMDEERKVPVVSL